MPGRGSHRQDPFHRINAWDDGYEYIQGQTSYPADSRNPPPYYSPPPMSGARHPPPEPNVSRRHTEDYRPRRRDPSPLSDYDAPRRRYRRDESPPPYRSVESHSPPPRRSHHHGEPLSRHKSTRNAPAPRSYGRSPSPPPRRSERDDRRRHHEAPRYRSPSPADRDRSRRHRSPDRHYTTRPASPPRHRAPPPQAAKPGLSRSKTTTSIGLSPRWQQAAAAALQAGSMAALSMRSEPGAWNGAKGAKVVTAALGAGMMKATAKGEPEAGRRSSGGGGGASRGPGGGGGGMKTKGAEMLAGFVAQQFAKHSQKGGARH